MKTKIKEALKTKYQNLGFGDKAIDGVADFLSRSVTKEEDIEATVTGAETLLKAFQGDADKRVTDAVSKEKIKWQQEHREPEHKTDPVTKTGDDEPEWVAKILQSHDAMTKRMDAMEKTNTMQGQHARMKAKLSDAKVPEIFYKNQIAGKAFKDDTEMDQFTNELVTGWEEVRQNLADQGLGQAHKPILGGATKEGVSQRVKDYLEAKANPEKGGDNLGGKKL